MKAHTLCISFDCYFSPYTMLEVDVIMDGDENIAAEKTLRLEIENVDDGRKILTQLSKEEAIELRDFLLYCYPKE